MRVLAPALLVWMIAACGSPAPPAPLEYTAGNFQNGQTLHLRVGDSVRVTLDSTAWTIAGSSDETVLRQEGVQAVSPAPPGTCMPGVGCGTTSALFRAVKAGTATVDASRVSCGEALACTGAEGRYEVTVVVR